MYVVDHLLDILTGNEHRKTSKYIEEMKNLRKGKYIIFLSKPEFNNFLALIRHYCLLNFVAFFHVASLFVKGVENRKALELTVTNPKIKKKIK